MSRDIRGLIRPGEPVRPFLELVATSRLLRLFLGLLGWFAAATVLLPKEPKKSR